MAKVTDYREMLKGVNRAEIARGCNCSTSYISQIMTEYHKPSEALRRRLEEFALKQMEKAKAPILPGREWKESELSEDQLQKIEADMRALPDSNSVKIHLACQMCLSGHWEFLCICFQIGQNLIENSKVQGIK
jgi:hypothetical protein